jgi:hypothetical protein
LADGGQLSAEFLLLLDGGGVLVVGLGVIQLGLDLILFAHVVSYGQQEKAVESQQRSSREGQIGGTQCNAMSH